MITLIDRSQGKGFVMARKRVTMQNIADACGLSRNTVSKIFNGRGSVPEGTRKLVLAKAQELGYSQLPSDDGDGQNAGGSIALLTQHKLLSHNFGAYFITSFTDQISRAGYNLKIYEISPREIIKQELPPHLDLGETVGFLGIELFNRAYLERICALNKPTVFVDGFVDVSRTLIHCDFVSMENVASEISLVRRMIDAGARRIGFVGDCEHCSSFHERWIGYNMALKEAGLQADRQLCILDEDSESYGETEWLLRKLEAMPEMPDGFACANDYLAIHLMTALKKMGLSIPEDVMVTGFDGSVEAELVSPSLSTARIPSKEIGRLAAALLTERIHSPESPFRRTYVQTVPIWGESTRE